MGERVGAPRGGVISRAAGDGRCGPQRAHLLRAEPLGSSLYCGDVVPAGAVCALGLWLRGLPQQPGRPAAAAGGVSANPGFPQQLGGPLGQSGLPPQVLAPPPRWGGAGPRAQAAAAAGAQRKGLVPACGAAGGGAAGSHAGSSGGGRLAGGGVKAPARGKALAEAGRVTPAGTLLRGRGREVL